jgi:hypothetical protein
MFHMADFEARKKPFDVFGNEERRALLSQLLDIALSHVPIFYGVVDEPMGHSPEFIARYQSNILKLYQEINIASAGSENKVTIVLAAHRNISCEKMGRWADLWRGSGSFEFGGFGNPESICALQVADIVAYEFSRHMREKKPEKPRYPLTRLKTAMGGCHLANARLLRYEEL